MAERKKLSVEEILAAARKADGGSGGATADDEPSPQEAPAVETSSTETAAPTAEQPAAKPATKPGERPSVADMLAMARSEKKGGEKPKPAATPKPAAKGPLEKAAPSSGEKPAMEKASEPTGPPLKSSILTGEGDHRKRGPVSKAEAATVSTAVKDAPDRVTAKGAAAKGKSSVPPMPAKPAYAKKARQEAKDKSGELDRRGFVGSLSLAMGTFLGAGFTSLAGTLGLWTLGTVRFMYPNVLTEPPSKFKVGFPAEYGPGFVETKFKSGFQVWIVNGAYNGVQQIYALSTVCTHLGCTPNWLEAEQKFKCPCHGSGFYKDGINFEGPAPRPLERYAIRIADDGQLEVDKSLKFFEEKGEWRNPDSFVPV